MMEVGLGFPLGPLRSTALLTEKYMVLLISSGSVQGQSGWGGRHVHWGGRTFQSRPFMVLMPELLNALESSVILFKAEEVWSLLGWSRSRNQMDTASYGAGFSSGE